MILIGSMRIQSALRGLELDISVCARFYERRSIFAALAAIVITAAPAKTVSGNGQLTVRRAAIGAQALLRLLRLWRLALASRFQSNASSGKAQMGVAAGPCATNVSRPSFKAQNVRRS